MQKNFSKIKTTTEVVVLILANAGLFPDEDQIHADFASCHGNHAVGIGDLQRLVICGQSQSGAVHLPGAFDVFVHEVQREGAVLADVEGDRIFDHVVPRNFAICCGIAAAASDGSENAPERFKLGCVGRDPIGKFLKLGKRQGENVGRLSGGRSEIGRLAGDVQDAALLR